MQVSHLLDISTASGVALSTGLFIGRIIFGLTLSAHGAQKLLGWFGGYGLNATGEFFAQIGFHPGRAFATIASLMEVVAGLLIALGLLGPVGPALMLSVMIVAAVSVHLRNGFFATANGIELPFLYSVVAVVLALTGPGAYSLDALLGLGVLWSPALVAGALVLGVVGGIANLAARRRAPSASGADLRTT